MSCYTFVASSRPLQEHANPYQRMMSLSRALERGYVLPDWYTPELKTGQSVSSVGYTRVS